MLFCAWMICRSVLSGATNKQKIVSLKSGMTENEWELGEERKSDSVNYKEYKVAEDIYTVLYNIFKIVLYHFLLP